jgi:hypothetical protein
MKKLLIALLFLPLNLFAANWYVRPNATGANNGADWNNAWSSSSINWSRVSAGDTVWLAGGNYSTGLTVSASGTAGNVINIKGALSTDPGPTTAAGWNPSFACSAHQISIAGPDGIYIPASSHISVDGRVQYGILITVPQSGGPGLEAVTGGNKGTDLTFRYIDVLGPYCNETNKQSPPDSEPRGWKVSPSNGSSTDASFILFNHCRVRGMGIGFHCMADHVTVEYCTFADMFPAFAGDHEDVLYCYPSPNMVWRYNFIINSAENGLFFEWGGADHLQIYGNVYYNTINSLITFKNGGGTYGPIFVYNNVFAAPSTSNYGWVTTNGSPMAAGSKVYNNIFFNVTNDLQQSTSDYNAYNYLSLTGLGWPSGEAHSFTFLLNPFVSLPPYTEPVATIGDFHLLPAFQGLFHRGITLAQDGYDNKDIDGNTRGAHGAWYVGAYEYASGNPTPTPTPTPKPTPTPTPKPTPTPTPKPTPTPTPKPTPTPTPKPTPTPTPAGTHSIFNSGAIPKYVNWADTNQVQLGVKFQSSVPATVTAIRFYKGLQNLGPHVVSLWSSAGTLLASATSNGETASGWQQVKLAAPVRIAANTTYIAAYHTNGYYSADPSFFTHLIANGGLAAPSSSASGGNGLYAYGSSSTFPGYTYNATNYWVDVVTQ